MARESADVLLTATLWMARGLLPLAVVGFLAATAGGVPSHLVTPASWLGHLGSGDATASLLHLLVTMALLFVGVALETLVICGAALACGEARRIAEVYAAARRLARHVRRAGLLVAPPSPSRPPSHLDRGAEHGILHQLRRALSISPDAPPLVLALVADPLGPARPSGHRAEVAACR